MRILRSITILAALAASAHAASPEISRVAPKGGQVGTVRELTLSGARLQKPLQIHFYAPGVEPLELREEGDKGTTVKVKFKIAPDCPLGEVPFRLRTASGLTAIRTFYVGPFPDVAEVEPNTEFGAPQQVGMNITVSGVVANEDVDHYAFEAKKGQRITAEVEAVRLGETLFDPYVAILNDKRFELAASDDHHLFLQDSMVSVEIPEDGTYTVLVRGSAYDGSDRAYYRLHLGTFARPLAVLPMGGQPGEEINFHFIGDVYGSITNKIKLPDSPGPFPLFVKDGASVRVPSPNMVRVTKLRNVMEKEPNSRADAAKFDFGEPPLAINGRMDQPDDDDWHRFKAKKGRAYHVNVYGRRLRSPIDTVVHIYKAEQDKKTVTSNDDKERTDSYVKFTAPYDGLFEVRVRDHLGQAGPQFTYRVEIEPVVPELTFSVPVYQRYKQDRQSIAVPRGNRYAIPLQAKRSDFGGDIKIDFSDLPAGVKATAPDMYSKVDQVPVLFEAAPDAPIGGTLAKVHGIHKTEQRTVEGGLRQPVDLVHASPNNTVYYGTHVDRIGIAVTEEAPFTIELVQPKVPIVNGGTMYLKVKAHRKEGFDEPIRLKMLYRPPGVSATSTVTIGKGKTETNYRLNANGAAEERSWKMAVIAEATVNGPLWLASNFIDLQVAKPFVGGKIELAAGEQGQEVDVICGLSQLKPFEGKAKIVLNGLPAGVKTEPVEITKDMKEVVFKCSTEAKSPKGQHKTLFCSVELPMHGEVILHSIAGGGVLRLDPPPPAPKKPVVAKKEPAKPKPPAVKRLSRLEQLRQKKVEEQGGP